jgi:hypothetical protein
VGNAFLPTFCLRNKRYGKNRFYYSGDSDTCRDRFPPADRLGFTYSVAIAFISLVGIAATLVVALSNMKSPSKGRVHVSDCSLYLLNGELWEFRYRATLMNVGDVDDSLEDVEHRLYKRHFGFLRSLLTSGARKLTDKSGHIWPHPLPTRIPCVVEGVGSVTASTYTMVNMLNQGPRSQDDYVLLCKFRFSKAKPVTVRINVHGIVQGNRLAAWSEELFLWIKTRGRNPLMPNERINP